ncbi:helix-turn-helix domain-containing protein [Candidatus Enterococcus clewellii]|uniref:HTH cro/C1-type domain-containing protein n=1 Tax=Candidatus Enterococcus clewellii TaxID=1834193 RepID=A0A242KC75_9ENTE|nr:helix-turn-helix transcriptional regulator [Enterococcus sp. 9E7_DIV0242]OTP18566.1 hypothetical protein A5888_000380 [Enterococcus sp. 9E7_DIV0242]
MTIGGTIRSYRKKRGMTQEGVAKQLNVSAGAVSKWETGTSLPDTELLIPLANTLQVSLDELFDFSLQLSEERLAEIMTEVTTCFEEQSFSDGLCLIKKYTQEFPHSEELVYQTAHLIWTYSLLSPFKDEEEVSERREAALEQYKRLFDSENERIRLNATYTGAVILMGENRVEELEKLLQKIPSTDYDTFYMTLHVLENKKEYSQARRLSLSKLFSRINEVCSLLAITGRLSEKVDDYAQATVCFGLLEKLEDNFDLITPSVTAPRKVKQLIEMGDKEAAARWFKKMVVQLAEQPLDWSAHPLFSSIQLSAGEDKQKKIRALYLEELLTDFNELSGYAEYEEAQEIISAF